MLIWLYVISSTECYQNSNLLEYALTYCRALFLCLRTWDALWTFLMILESQCLKLKIADSLSRSSSMTDSIRRLVDKSGKSELQGVLLEWHKNKKRNFKPPSSPAESTIGKNTLPVISPIAFPISLFLENKIWGLPDCFWRAMNC